MNVAVRSSRPQGRAVVTLGATAYWDTTSGERSAAATAPTPRRGFIGGGVLGYDLACSGARTTTHGTAAGENFKPGIDFYSDAQGRVGQARALQSLAVTRNVVMIGGRQLRLRRHRRALVTN